MTNPDRLPETVSPRTTMVGGGLYDENARHQRTAVSLAMPLLGRAIEAVPLPADGAPFVLADYGSATGFNTFAPARKVVSEVRRRGGTSIPICVVHNDQADNDYAALFRGVATSAESYAHEKGVFVLAAGASFYRPVLPPRFVSLGWSANAAHWLSEVPCCVSGRLSFRRPADGVATPFGQRAHEDWTRFLQARAIELRPGGALVVAMVEADDSGSSGADHFLDVLTEVLAAQVESNALRAGEVARMIVPLYFRTEREIRLPWQSTEIADALALVEYEHAILDDPLWTTFERTGDRSTFARQHVAWLRGYSENVLFTRLDADRTALQAREIADAAYDAVRERVERSPDRAKCSWKLALLRIARPS